VTREWDDAEYMYQIHTANRMLVGAPPTHPQDYLKRHLLALGASATIFASNRRVGDASVASSKKGPRRLKSTTPLKDIFLKRYNNGAPAIRPMAAKARRYSAPDPILQRTTAGESPPSRFTLLETLLCVREGVASEELHLLLDYFGLHQRGLELMHTLKTELRDDLVNYFGHEPYFEDDSKLAFIIGFVFEAVSGNDRAAEKLNTAKSGSKILEKASVIVHKFLDEDHRGVQGVTDAKAYTRRVDYLYERDALDQLQAWDPQRSAREVSQEKAGHKGE
jgi:hypothetical protein